MSECFKNIHWNVLGFKAGKHFEVKHSRDSIERLKTAAYKASEKGEKRRKILKFNKSIKAQNMNLKDKEEKLHETGCIQLTINPQLKTF